MKKCSVVGATGYTGTELVRLLSDHPEVRLVAATSRHFAGRRFTDMFPHLTQHINGLTFSAPEPETLARESDCVFLATPHGVSADIAAELLARNRDLLVIDLSADFRLKDPAAYAQWYGHPHTHPELLPQAVYGLPEIEGAHIRGARLIANPGCYPTSVILAAAPLLKAGLTDPASLIADSKSGVTGAGREPTMGTHFPEVNESMKAYGVTKHRHTPEIEQELGLIAGAPLFINFTPHLLPINRGILSTVYASNPKGLSKSDLLTVYHEFYKAAPFVRVYDQGLPEIRHVRGSNFCDIGFEVDTRTKRIVLVSALDNLLKGAAGQAVQNMNIAFGFPETEGLKAPGIGA
ncbi:MAG TPA: N-acetyl-gamma-glutamyl-phosphate reductase [Candidatus Thermoplasmatota archaeon]|nr:N-acetyl-gamma-glutamyl-phosphate reductase [Candidatus Thermoplasmatota archaeon]